MGGAGRGREPISRRNGNNGDARPLMPAFQWATKRELRERVHAGLCYYSDECGWRTVEPVRRVSPSPIRERASNPYK